MSKLTKKDVLHVADLSNLKLTDAEIKKFTPQLEKIIEFVGILNDVDTSDIVSTSQTIGLTNVLRDDVIRTDQTLNNNDFYKVPVILSERSNQ